MISDHLLSQVIVGIGNKITKEVRLRVKTPVAILDSSTAKLTVVEGEEAKLECKVSRIVNIFSLNSFKNR